MTNSRINLNLLICLHHILQEQSVSQAAQKMFISQSAMSKKLAQLRGLLNDPIIIRNKGCIEVTEAAQSMKTQVESIVHNAINFFENFSFSSNKVQKKFSVLCDEIIAKQFIPKCMCKLTQHAPEISFDLIPESPNALLKLEKGDIDIGLFFSQEKYLTLNSTTILKDQLVVILNKEHPLNSTSMTTKNFTDYPFITLTPEHKQYINTASLIDASFKRKVVAKLPSISMILNMVTQKNYITILPKSSLNIAEQKELLTFKILPFPEENNVPLNLLWHSNQHHNTANQWLRTWLKNNMLICSTIDIDESLTT